MAYTEKIERAAYLEGQRIPELAAEIEDTQEALAHIEASIALAVFVEESPAGKPAFSNETARKAETFKRQDADPTHRKLAQGLREAKLLKAAAEAEAVRLRRELRFLALEMERENVSRRAA